MIRQPIKQPGKWSAQSSEAMDAALSRLMREFPSVSENELASAVLKAASQLEPPLDVGSMCAKVRRKYQERA